MQSYYSDKQDYLDQIRILEDALDELSKFDVHNDDLNNAQIFNIGRDIISMKERLVNEMNKIHFNWNNVEGINRTAEDQT